MLACAFDIFLSLLYCCKLILLWYIQSDLARFRANDLILRISFIDFPCLRCKKENLNYILIITFISLNRTDVVGDLSIAKIRYNHVYVIEQLRLTYGTCTVRVVNCVKKLPLQNCNSITEAIIYAVWNLTHRHMKSSETNANNYKQRNSALFK